MTQFRKIAETRETWRETRINQALLYPNLRVPITRKLMRLSGNCCMICGRHTHVAGDELCMELSSYHMIDERRKKKEIEKAKAAEISNAKAEGRSVTRSGSGQRISIAKIIPPPASSRNLMLPALHEDLDDDDAQVFHERHKERLGKQLLAKHWKDAELVGLHLPRPAVMTAFASSCG